MKSDLRVAAIICSLVLVLSSIAFSQEYEVRLPGGSVHLSTLPAQATLDPGSLVVVRFAAGADMQKESLDVAGITLHFQVAPRVWWATAKNGGFPSSAAITSVYQPRPDDKILPMLWDKIVAGETSVKTAVRVSLLPGISQSEAESVIQSAGGIVTGKLLMGGSIEARIPADQIHSLASSDKIIAVGPGGRQRRVLNRRAVTLSKGDLARSEFGLSGDGIVAGIWDGGPVFDHKEFAGRLIVAETGKSDDHATHVAGTIGATGLKTKARGFAPKATIVSYNFNGDIPFEINKAFEKYGVSLANNSWGYGNGWEWEGEWVWYGTEFFGSYSDEAKAFDDLVFDTGIIVVFAAGNDRGDKGAGNGSYYDAVVERQKRNEYHSPDGPYDTIGQVATAKNVIAVGAVKDNGPMTTFSSWGPTDDGRIKPEVVANGQTLYSTVLRNHYGNSSGTSMATPAVTGGLTLVSEMWQRIYGERLQADMARALLAATAQDEGRPGPDFTFGFGIMDVEAMVELIDSSADSGAAQYGSVTTNSRKQTYDLVVPSNASGLHVAIAWLDPAAAPFAQISLVNDLDLTLTAPNGTVIRPWKLNPAAPAENATRGINSVDNIELVEVENPAAGTWKITVEGSSLGSGSSQIFALVAKASSELLIN